jgi:CRISPR-associated protein Cas2
VQKSVFECQVDLARFETLERELLAEIDVTQDNLRLYRMPT